MNAAADGTGPPHTAPILFPGHRRLRHVTYALVSLAALGLSLSGMDEMMSEYQLGVPQSLLAGFGQGVALVLALRRPVPAWALSLTATAVTALAARAAMDPRPALGQVPTPGVGPGPDWPWSTTEVVVQAAVLLLVALRVPTRRALAALAVTGLTTFVIQGVLGAQSYSSTGVSAVVVCAVAVLIGTALRGRSEARTQLVEQVTITAEERNRRTLLEERSRIARELHDVVAHHMSVISIQAQVAPHLVENPSEELLENLAGIRQNALEALTELRRVLGVLRSENPDYPEDPYALAAPGTGAAPDSPQPTLDRLDALIENTRAAGLDVRGDVRGEVRPLAPGVELSAYRIVQEALSNALRHAPGSTVAVEVAHGPDGLRLFVTNSRPQQAAPPSPGAGHGLLGMRERAAMLGGHLTAARTFQGGFAVVAFLPRDGVALPDGPDGPDAPDAPDGPADPGTSASAAPEIIFPTGDETP
ncbi:sensor histidine kinase [Streptomyces sp. W16]|uniref:sensor histidine kinase n=1 Tax=Streptomyces sp. W16 TaxID=3076631 RepID=UPI00295AC507|nr:sensor histidine kinase [Streptomyces sp. W16]MDV9172740.1 sensor histidine kinase [Streptomyces sp. W16]